MGFVNKMVRTLCVGYCFSRGSDLLAGLVSSGLRRDASERGICVGGDAEGSSGEVVPAGDVSGRASSSSASSDNAYEHVRNRRAKTVTSTHPLRKCPGAP